LTFTPEEIPKLRKKTSFILVAGSCDKENRWKKLPLISIARSPPNCVCFFGVITSHVACFISALFFTTDGKTSLNQLSRKSE
jgi:hypothetical protein